MTNPLFSQDGKTATILLAGLPGDPDPVGLWNALAAPPENFQGKLAKRFELLGPGGTKAFDVDCVFSAMFQNNGTCTVILRATPGLIEVDRAAGRARLWLSGEEAARFAGAFAVRDESSMVYRSQNGRLNFTVARDRGVITDFVVDWK
jgi:hypothetical protein